MASRKRLFEEIESLDSIKNPIPNANLHAAVSQVSPMQKGKNTNYFDGSISDGTCTMRVIGFTAEQQKKLSFHMEGHDSACLVNCEVKRSRQGDSFEIILKKFTEIRSSEKKFEEGVINSKINSPETVAVASICDKGEFTRISVDAKVIFVHDPIQMASGKIKQDIIIADSTGTTRLVLWESDVNSVTLNKSYKFNNIVIKEFQETKYLALGRVGSAVSEIDDIGNVATYNTDIDYNIPRKLKNAEIVAIVTLDCYKSCLRCKARVEGVEDLIGICSKCGIHQRVDKCSDHLTGKLLLQEQGNDKTLTLSAFGSTLTQMAAVDSASQVTPSSLLMAPILNTVIYNKDVIISIERD